MNSRRVTDGPFTYVNGPPRPNGPLRAGAVRGNPPLRPRAGDPAPSLASRPPLPGRLGRGVKAAPALIAQGLGTRAPFSSRLCAARV